MMSVPLPAMLVAIVMLPFRPLCPTVSDSRSTFSGLAFSSWCFKPATAISITQPPIGNRTAIPPPPPPLPMRPISSTCSSHLVIDEKQQIIFFLFFYYFFKPPNEQKDAAFKR